MTTVVQGCHIATCDAAGVLLEVNDCRATFPNHYVRLLAFDATVVAHATHGGRASVVLDARGQPIEQRRREVQTRGRGGDRSALAREDGLIALAVTGSGDSVWDWDVLRDRRLNSRPEVVGGVLAYRGTSRRSLFAWPTQRRVRKLVERPTQRLLGLVRA